MTIPKDHRDSFFSHMRAADDGQLELKAWLHRMLRTAEEFLAKHRIDEEPRAAVVYYCKRLDLGKDFED